MCRMEVIEGFAQLFDIRGGENGANVEVARYHARAMKDGAEYVRAVKKRGRTREVRPLLPGNEECPYLMSSTTGL